ncbi:MAG: DNA polymerase IV [Oscillospiraceae bacterium]|jgi:DNA polymerase-4|nr:DNA polymerase IV [Oscillospiraceae bacterium]
MKNRIIFHCDCDCFFASVEQTFHPEYKNVPMAIAGDPKSRRGIILAKNQLAKGFGIKTAETVWAAQQKCPELLLAPPRRRAYGEFCDRVNAIYEEYTDLVERAGIDESFLDVTGCLHGFQNDPLLLARELQARIEREIGITVSIGISWNKIFAKLGSDRNKPSGIFVVTRENFRETVWPLPVTELFLVGRNTAAALKKIGITTIGELAQADRLFLRQTFGKMGDQLHINAAGKECGAVRRTNEAEQVKSVGNGLTFSRDLVTRDEIHTGVLALCHSVARRLRRAGLRCMTVQVTIKDTSLRSIQRQKSIARPTFLASELIDTAMEIIQANWQAGKPIRLITVTAQNLVPAEETAEQLSFFAPDEGGSKKAESLAKATDAIRTKYGKYSILPGVILHNDLGITDRDEEDDEDGNKHK